MSTSSNANFVARITLTHTIAYFTAGIFALLVLNYDEIFNVGALSFMRPTDSAWVAAGAGLQILRGILLGLVLLPFREVFEQSDKGWLKFALLNFGLAYVLTISAAVGSFEGVIYTNLPLAYHLIGLPEILLYTALFTGMLWFWDKQPRRAYWFIAGGLVSVIALMSFMGVLAAFGVVQAPA